MDTVFVENIKSQDQCFGSGSWTGSGFMGLLYPDSESGPGSRGLKKELKSSWQQHYNIIFFDWLLLMNTSFNCEIILHYFQTVLRNRLDPDWDFWLDPDPCSMNTDRKHWSRVSSWFLHVAILNFRVHITPPSLHMQHKKPSFLNECILANVLHCNCIFAFLRTPRKCDVINFATCGYVRYFDWFAHKE